MRHTAGQPAHGFHLLRVEQLVLQTPLLNEIVYDDENGLASVQLEQARMNFNVDNRLVLAAVAPDSRSLERTIGRSIFYEPAYVVEGVNLAETHRAELVAGVAIEFYRR